MVIVLSRSNITIRAKQFCEANKHRFTEPRERVLSLLVSANEPMGPYQILDALSDGKEKVQPPTVYRAIDFWSRHGFIHRVASMNAYIACCDHQRHENFCIFICNECNKVLELKTRSLHPTVTNAIENHHLTITQSFTEMHGKCSECN